MLPLCLTRFVWPDVFAMMTHHNRVWAGSLKIACQHPVYDFQ